MYKEKEETGLITCFKTFFILSIIFTVFGIGWFITNLYPLTMNILLFLPFLAVLLRITQIIIFVYFSWQQLFFKNQ